MDRSNGINEVLKDPEAKPHSGDLLHQWCSKMRKLGITEVPIIRLIADNEDHAFDMEGVLTHHIGIISEGGILYNGRHGGKGGYSLQECTKKLLSELNSGENNPNWGTTWSDERRAKWYRTWESQDRSRTPESMQKAWAAYRKKYQIANPFGEQFVTDDLTNWCKKQGLPLSAFRKALKGNGIVQKSPKKRSRVEGWSIRYL